jgi:hypothetical protein
LFEVTLPPYIDYIVQTPFFIPVLRNLRFKNLQKIPFGEGHVQDPISALPGYGSKIPALLLGDT